MSPGGDFFEAVLLLAAVGNRISRSLEKCSFSTISDESFKLHFLWVSEVTLGSFLARFLELARPAEAWCFDPGR